jgi:putative transposase
VTRVQWKKKKYLPTIRRIPDDVWNEIKDILPPEKPPKTVGRPAVPYRTVLYGILYVLRTGCQWKSLPKEYGSGSTCHRRFQEWVRLGVFQKLWVRLLEIYDDVRGIKWRWQQSLDSGTSVKAPLGGDKPGPNPTDRGKLGTKRHVLTDQIGDPLSAVITAANSHDMKAAAADTLDSIIVRRRRPQARKYRRQHLCLDKGYDFPEIVQKVIKRRYMPHIRHRVEKKRKKQWHKRKRRWVVERTNSWHNRFRKLLVRYEKRS